MTGSETNGQGAPRPVLTVRDLCVQVATEAGAKTVLDGLSFDLRRWRSRAKAVRANR